VNVFSHISCVTRPRSRVFALTLVTAAAIGGRAPAHAAGDPSAGKTVFANQCSICHSVVKGQNGVGPSLAALINRRSAGLPDYKYSAAMSGAGLIWDVATLEDFLRSPMAKVPGSVMVDSIADANARSNVIAYLATLGVAPASTSPEAAPTATPLLRGPTQQELLAATDESHNWLYASKDYSGQRYAALRQITASNAARLRPVCIYRSDNIAATQSNPLVYEGTLYLTMNEVTVALDAATCRQQWGHRWVLKDGALSKVNRGVALKEGRLIRGTPDGYLIALNMRDGSLLWSRKIADAKSGQYLSMPPLIFENRIIYGPAGADWGAKNWIGAFELESGEPLWRFNLIPDANEPGAETWSDPRALQHGGASVWTPLSLDAKRGTLYVPVGNPAPDFFPAARPGDDLYTDSAVALDVRTGKLLWYHQFGPADVHDLDLSQVSPLFSGRINGESHDLVAISGKDGLLRALDRVSHQQLYQKAVTTRTNSDVAPTQEGTHSCPGPLGGLEWNGPAYSPASQALYVATVDRCATFIKSDQVPQYTVNAPYRGGSVVFDPPDQARGWLQSIDAATGSEHWKRQWPTPLVAGITVTAGGVLFTGDLDNNFLALDAATGKTLYSFNTGGSIGGGVISYELNGKQYVAAVSGTVSAYFGGSGTAAVVVFALP
jgi:alcohol dehydrogenase (cytochrome c)